MRHKKAGFWERRSVFVAVTAIKAIGIVAIVFASITGAAPDELRILIPILLISVFSQVYVQVIGESPLQTVGRWAKRRISSDKGK